MSKRVIVVHGWCGYPEEGWFPWLKKELEQRGFEVIVPQLPEPRVPRINNWVPKLREVVGQPDEQTYFVGHSMGCQTIARYLESLPEGTKVGGAVFVAGFFKRLTGIEEGEESDVVREWLETPLDLASVRARLKGSVAVFSDNDHYVPLDNQDDFAQKLGSRIVIEHAQKHFSGSTGTTELLVALEAVLELAGEKS